MTKEADRQTSDQRPNQTHKPWNGDSQIPESVDKHSQWSSAVAEAGQDRLRFIWTLNRRELPHSCCSAVYSEIEKSTLSNHSGSLSSAPVFLQPPPPPTSSPPPRVLSSGLNLVVIVPCQLYSMIRPEKPEVDTRSHRDLRNQTTNCPRLKVSPHLIHPQGRWNQSWARARTQGYPGQLPCLTT